MTTQCHIFTHTRMLQRISLAKLKLIATVLHKYYKHRFVSWASFLSLTLGQLRLYIHITSANAAVNSRFFVHVNIKV